MLEKNCRGYWSGNVNIKAGALALLAGLHLVAASGTAAAQPQGQPVDPTTLYELTTQGSSQRIKAGAKGTFVVALKTKNGSHVSSEAPFKIEISGKGVKPEKATLSLADAVEKKPVKDGVIDPRFEVPFTAASVGKAAVDAKLTFFICTEKICARQQKALSVPVEVD
jgi:hypothetical protein